MRWASHNSGGVELADCLRAECPKSLVLADELFFGLWRRNATERGHDALDMLRDLALGEFTGVTKGKH